MNPSPIRVAHGPNGPLHVCLACTSAERRTVFATDPIAHVQECHPHAAPATQAQFAPRHHKIVRTAR